MTQTAVVKLSPNPVIEKETLRTLASKGWTLEMCGSVWDLYDHELDKILKRNKDLQRAYDMGYIKFKATLNDKINNTNDRGFLLLAARMHLKLDDPIMEKLAGNLLNIALSKTNKETKKTLATILGIQ